MRRKATTEQVAADALTIRRATPADARACSALDRLCFPEPIAYPRDVFDDLCAKAEVMLLVEDRGHLVAVAAAQREAETGSGLLVTLDVHPDWRRRGLGSLLLTEVHRELREGQIGSIYLHVAVGNRAAQRLYRRHGYDVVKRIPDYYGDRQDALMMARGLADGTS